MQICNSNLSSQTPDNTSNGLFLFFSFSNSKRTSELHFKKQSLNRLHPQQPMVSYLGLQKTRKHHKTFYFGKKYFQLTKSIINYDGKYKEKS